MTPSQIHAQFLRNPNSQTLAALDAAYANSTLYVLRTGEPLRRATRGEVMDSITAAERDGGTGAIRINSTICYCA